MEKHIMHTGCNMLIQKNKRLYGAYHKARDRMQQSLTVKANLDLMLQLNDQHKEKE